MKLFKKNENKKTTKLPMTKKVKKGFRYYCMAVMAMTFVLGTSVTAFAANDPIQVVNNLSDFIFGLVRAVGMIMLGFGIVQIGLSLKSHDPSQRANGFLTLAGGVVITFAKESFNPNHRLKNSRIHNRIRHIHKDYLYLSRICSKDNSFRLVLRAKALLNLSIYVSISIVYSMVFNTSIGSKIIVKV